jgi:hypothetical protein
MRGHFRYLRFKTFPTTPRTPQCEVFCPLLSSSEHSGVPEGSKSPTFPSVGLHPHTWPKWGCDRSPHVVESHFNIHHFLMPLATSRVEVFQFVDKKGLKFMECNKSNLHLWVLGFEPCIKIKHVVQTWALIS